MVGDVLVSINGNSLFKDVTAVKILIRSLPRPLCLQLQQLSTPPTRLLKGPPPSTIKAMEKM